MPIQAFNISSSFHFSHSVKTTQFWYVKSMTSLAAKYPATSKQTTSIARKKKNYLQYHCIHNDKNDKI